jgi:hypothetical protein
MEIHGPVPTALVMVMIRALAPEFGVMMEIFFASAKIPAFVFVMMPISVMIDIHRWMRAVSAILVPIAMLATVMSAPAENFLQKIHCRLPLRYSNDRRKIQGPMGKDVPSILWWP